MILDYSKLLKNVDLVVGTVPLVVPKFREEDSGGAEEDRTPDLLRARQSLSQLSYGPKIQALAPAPWWVWVDLNHRPRPYQGRALTY